MLRDSQPTLGFRSRRIPAVADYARHEPEKTLLHEVIRAELEPFMARTRAAGAPVARFVEREIRAYLDCGVLAHGFLRVHCDACGCDRLVAFSCKGRGFCPSCGGRRMADTAAHLVERVLPEVPVRQWVLTLPYPLRYRCAWNSRLTSEVLSAFLRSVFADQRLRARRLFGVRKGQCGSVTFIQRFGSALNLAPHFHSLVLDGVYPGPSHQSGDFVALPPPLAPGRLEAMADGRLAYRLKTPWRDGTTHVVMERRELLERLAPLIPPPRAHQVRYRGVLAPCASARDQVVPAGPNPSGADLAETARPESNEPSTGCIESAEQDAPGAVPASPSSCDSSADRSDSFARRIAWADLLKRVFEIDALRCPGCGGRMRLMASITDASIAGRILESLALPPRAPPLAPANQDASRSVVEGDASFELPGTQYDDDAGLEFDQTPDDDRLSNEGA
ncbi:MAG: transposase [Myxococcota bacterium]